MVPRWHWLALAALLLAGCSRQLPTPPEAVKVRGKVLLGNGQPVTYGRVTFHPKDLPAGIEAWGELKSDGSFTLTTYRQDDGAVPGTYVVTVEPLSYRTGNLCVASSSPIPKRYQEADTSKLVVEVKPGDNVLDPLYLR